MSVNLDVIKKIHSAQPYSQSLLNSNALADDVEWWAAGLKDELPWAGSWYGEKGIRDFFRALSELMNYQVFEPKEYIAQDEVVVSMIEAAGWAKTTAEAFKSDIVRIYDFRNDKIVKIRNFYDTAAYVRALHPPRR